MAEEEPAPEAFAPAAPPASAADLAGVAASVASLRADVAEASVHLAALRTLASAWTVETSERKAGMIEVMSDIVRLNQKLDRLADSVGSVAAEVDRIGRSAATKGDVERLMAAIAAAKAR